MRRRITAALATTVLAGGLLAAAVPAQAAPVTTDAVARGPITCKPSELRQQAAQLDRKADKEAQLGNRTEAARLHELADAYRAKAKACEDADNGAGSPFPG
ncbi:hypothetical protein ABT160_13365 [Streptomyces sp. NPDC001941]|uniref:hypothetical protein n=1 Tax=Streptomyces sp. NPDC001941 TaxID=3154659 RepID=UPI003318EFA1